MKIDKRTIPNYKKSKQPYIGLNIEYMDDTGFLPGDDIIIIYDKDKIIVTREVTSVTVA